MSPADASLMSTRFRPSKAYSFVTFVSCTAAIELADDDRIADLDAAVEDPADRDASQVVARIEIGDQQLQRRVGIAARRRHVRRRWRRTAAAGPGPAVRMSVAAVPARALV